MIEIRDLVIAYNEGSVVAVNNLNLDVPAGQVLGVLGGNGAGKTSTMRVLGGIQPPTSGFVGINGYDMSKISDSEHAREVVGFCPDTGGLVRQATVREHVAIALALRNQTARWPYALELIEKFGLTNVLDRPTSGFSHGMSRRLSVLLAALTAEKVLVLDEPFDGVDPTGVSATEELINNAKQAGLAVVISTHLLPLLTRVSDRIVVMVEGKLVDDAPATVFAGEVGSQRYASQLVAR